MSKQLIFDYVHLKNFLSYKDVKLTLSDKGLVYVSGQNKDDNNKSNGSGKSTLLCDSITWALFGKLIRDIPVGKIPNRFVKGQCSVELVFFIDDVKYLVRRTRRPDDPLVFEINGEDKARGDSRDTTRDIATLLGMGFTEFINSILFGQNIQKYFFLLTDAKQKDMLDNIIDIGTMMDAYKSASVSQRDKAIELYDQKKQQVEEKTNLITLCRQRIRDYDEKGKEYVEREKERIDNAYGSLTRHIVLVEAQIGKAKNRIEEIGDVSEYDKLNKQNNELTTGIHKLVLLKQESERVVIRESGLDIVEGQLVLLNSSETRSIPELDAENTRLTEEIISYQSQLQTKVELAKQHKTKMDSMTSMQNTDCPTCGRLVDDTCVKSVAEEYDKLVTNLQKEAADVKERLDDIKNKQVLVNNALSDRRNLELFELIKTAKIDVGKYDSMITVLRQQQDSLSGRLQALRLQVDELTLLKTQLASNEQDKKSTLQRQKELLEERKKAEEDPYTELKAKEIENINQYDLQIQRNQLEQDVFLQYVEACKYWEKAFGDRDGIKGYIYDKVFPFLNARCNYYLSILSNNQIVADIGVDAKGRFVVKTINKTGAEVYGGNSGGERRRIDMSIMLALHDLVSSRKHRSNILILDEIFDYLDVSGVDAAMNLLSDISPQYDSIFVVSHTDFAEYFDNHISIVKDGNISTVVD